MTHERSGTIAGRATCPPARARRDGSLWSGPRRSAHRWRTLLAIAAAAPLSGTAATAPAEAGKYNNEEKRIEMVEPEEGRALVYVVRTSKAGMIVHFWTFVDESFIAVTRGPGYNYAQVDPGRRMIWTKAENVAALDVDLEAGQTYYVKQVVLPGFGKARTRVELLSAEEGREAIEKAKKISVPTPKAEEKAAELVAEHLDRARRKADEGDEDEEG